MNNDGRSFIEKLNSRKFWAMAAAFLASVSSSIAGIATKNETLTAVGLICGTLSAAIYAAIEASVDIANIKSNVTETRVTKTEAKNYNTNMSKDLNADQKNAAVPSDSEES